MYACQAPACTGAQGRLQIVSMKPFGDPDWALFLCEPHVAQWRTAVDRAREGLTGELTGLVPESSGEGGSQPSPLN